MKGQDGTSVAALNKHQQRTEATRRKLLSSALRIFARDGFEGSRIEDIAADAGHTRGAFYANFDTKEDLFLALLEQQSAKRVGEVKAAISDPSDRKQRLHEMRKYYVARSADKKWAILVLEFKMYALRHSKQRAKLAAAHQRIRESIHLESMKQLDSERGPSAMKQGAIKVLLEVLLTGLVLEHSYDPKRVSREEMDRMLGHLFDMLTD